MRKRRAAIWRNGGLTVAILILAFGAFVLRRDRIAAHHCGTAMLHYALAARAVSFDTLDADTRRTVWQTLPPFADGPAITEYELLPKGNWEKDATSVEPLVRCRHRHGLLNGSPRVLYLREGAFVVE